MKRMACLEEQVVDTTSATMNTIFQKAYQQSTKAELIHFPHVISFSPVQSTWLESIKQGFFNEVLVIRGEMCKRIYKNHSTQQQDT